MKVLSLNQVRKIEECYNEIRNGVYNYDHLESAYNLITAHYNGWDYMAPSIQKWYKKYYAQAHLTALQREENKKNIKN